MLFKGFVCAIACAAVAGALWVGVAAASGWELTLLAIVLGGAAGFGMGMGNQGRGGVPAGVLAAVAALVCILGAKVGVAHMLTQRWMESEALAVSEEDARDMLMSTIYDTWVQEGVEMTETDDFSFPPEVYSEANRRWHAMSLDEREMYRAGLEEEQRAEVQQASGVFTLLTLIFSFGFFDLLCMGLAMGTAFKGGATIVHKNEDGELEVETVQAPALFRAAIPEPPATPAILPQSRQTPAPAAPEQPATPALGIFSLLGNQPEPPARSILQPEDDATPSDAGAPEPRAGLINLDFTDEERRAA